MSAAWAFGLLAVVALLVLPQVGCSLGWVRGGLVGLIAFTILGGSWLWLAHSDPPEAKPDNWAAVASLPSDSCAKCHEGHYESWHRSYHRTMTRDAAPDTVKGDFNNATYVYQGLPTRLTRQGHQFFMETVDPEWALAKATKGERGDRLPPPRFQKFSVDRLVGSHWIQECMHRDATGRYTRLPVLYHIVEQRWIHSNGAFLSPDTDDFWDKCRRTAWNDSCLYCHNTGPVKNPKRGLTQQVVGYDTRVAELGIACEACHGPAGDHVRLNHNPARRLSLQQMGVGDPSIVHPGRLSVPRRDEICARCHGAIVPKPEKWDPRTHRDPFIAGQELGQFNHFFHSEAEQAKLSKQPEPEGTDGRFWSDGTPLTTALEYNGMALSACYQKGQGQMSCLSCHQMHNEEPNFLLKPGMKTNEACLQCHEEYRNRLTDHTRHGATSAGSQCQNCHMPHVVYSLLNTHRSHRIENPDVATSLKTGKPHACNLCHLDKSLGWTRDQLHHWSDRAKNNPPPLSEEDQNLSHALLLLAKGDARSRVMVAGAFANPDAQQASGTDWFGPFLTRLLEDERYPAVRYLAHRGLRTVHGDNAVPFDYLALPTDRTRQLQALRKTFDAVPLRRSLPHLPLTPGGLPDEAVLRHLLKKRNDPDLTINE